MSSLYKTRNFHKKVVSTTLRLNDNLRLVFHATHYTHSGYKQLNYEVFRVNAKSALQRHKTPSTYIMKGNFRSPTPFLNQTLYRSKSPNFNCSRQRPCPTQTKFQTLVPRSLPHHE